MDQVFIVNACLVGSCTYFSHKSCARGRFLLMLFDLGESKDIRTSKLQLKQRGRGRVQDCFWKHSTLTTFAGHPQLASWHPLQNSTPRDIFENFMFTKHPSYSVLAFDTETFKDLRITIRRLQGLCLFELLLFINSLHSLAYFMVSPSSQFNANR